MGRSLNGYLMLGWQVDDSDMRDHTGELDAALTEILGERYWWYADPIQAPTVYERWGFSYVGLVIMDDESEFEPESWGAFISSNAKLLTDTAKRIYKAVVGSEPDTEPTLMPLACEG